MTLFESPRALAFDGTLTTWAVYVITHSPTVLIEIGTLILVVIRIMLLWRQWRRG